MTSSIEHLKKEYPEFADQFEVYKLMLKAQEPLIKDPKKGTKIDWNKATFLSDFQKQALEKNEPISFLFNSSIYDINALYQIFHVLIDNLVKNKIEGWKTLQKLKNQGKEFFSIIIQRALRRDGDFFETVGDRLNINTPLLSTLIDILLQPSMELVATYVAKNSFLDVWDNVMCPICGKIPFLVVKQDEEKWKFKCTFCNAQWPMNIFQCPCCGNRNFQKLGFLMLKDDEAFEIGHCEECKGYYKILNLTKLREVIPRGLEDFYSRFLDKFAEQRGFQRLDYLLSR